MKPFFYLIALISTLGINSVTWAGPTEEIAQVIQQQSAAGQKNDVAAHIAPFCRRRRCHRLLDPLPHGGKGGNQGTTRAPVPDLSDPAVHATPKTLGVFTPTIPWL